MKASLILSSILSAVTIASPLSLVRRAEGSGPYKAIYVEDYSLPSHTIYRPENMSAVAGNLPVIVWGNGGCTADGRAELKFKYEIASHGFILIASGAPRQSGSTTGKWMTDSINWAQKNAGKGQWSKMNAGKIAAAGYSCGGLEAYEQAGDSRITALGIFSSGQFTESDTNRVVPKIKKPIFYFMGGPTDIAYNNGHRDYDAVSTNVPAWIGDLPTGHEGTFKQTNGGKFATAGVQYFKAVLKNDVNAKSYFTGTGAKNAGWTVQSKSLNKL